jgi:hypothetical protein
MASKTELIPASLLQPAGSDLHPQLPRDCTFPETAWSALAPQWYPVASSHEVTGKPYAVRLLDQRLVVYQLRNGTVTAAQDICFHRGAPLSLGTVEGDEIVADIMAFTTMPPVAVSASLLIQAALSLPDRLSKGPCCDGLRPHLYCMNKTLLSLLR